MLTDVQCVQLDFGRPNPKRIERATPESLRKLQFPSGSMGPKVEAVCRFVERTGRMAAIGRLEDAGAILAGRTGTVVTPSGHSAEAFTAA